MTADQIEAITHAWLGLRGAAEVIPPGDFYDGLIESFKELERAFPFLLEEAGKS